MIPIAVPHGVRLTFLRMLRDHILVWDPKIRAEVDIVGRREFNISFEEVLINNPKWIARRCPRYVPRPELLVPAINLVYATCENATDAKTGLPLFSAKG